MLIAYQIIYITEAELLNTNELAVIELEKMKIRKTRIYIKRILLKINGEDLPFQT